MSKLIPSLLLTPARAPDFASANEGASPVQLLDAAIQPMFVNDLPIPQHIAASRPAGYVIQMRETEQWLGLVDEDGHPLTTTVWGYGQPGTAASYPGPTLVAYEDSPIRVNWMNMLPLTGHLLPVDTTVHYAHSGKKSFADVEVPTVTHLHGGHTASGSDGLPEAWFTQYRTSRGPGFRDSIYTYGNDQDAATLWYHDHALGVTRLNVYAGLAGFYLLNDENRQNLVNQGVLPGGPYEIEIVIQDRAFTSDGQLYYPAYKSDRLPGTEETVGDVVPQSFYDLNGEDAPSAVPEFFGDHILVNGMAWPNLDVVPGDYQFRLLNGSDSRFYVLQLSDPDLKVHLIGVDGGLLPAAYTIVDGDGVQEPGEQIVLAPGDRVDLVIDFSGAVVGSTVRLLNVGPLFEPFKGLDADGTLAGDVIAATSHDPVGNILQFTVRGGAAPAIDAAVVHGTPLVPNFTGPGLDSDGNGIADLATNVRRLGLFEGVDEFGRIQPLLGTAEEGALHSGTMSPDGRFGPLAWNAPITERPALGSIEQWEFLNFTEDAHPVHLHLTMFETVRINKIYFMDEDEDGLPDDTDASGSLTYGTGTPDFARHDIWIGEEVAIAPELTGMQDTVHVAPGEMVSVAPRFDLPGLYVWHCHILSHEDHEMMRPFFVGDSGWVQ